MPAPLAAAAIAAGATALSTGGQIYAAGKMNKKTRQWNEKMYGIQRQDAMNDWNMQNAYNSPEAQMQRFKAAGLNPNLIYGQQNEGATVRSTDVKSWNPETPDIQTGVKNSIEAFADYTLQQEQVKNMQAARENMAADKLVKEATAVNLLTQGQTMEFDLGQKQRLADTIMQQATATLRQTQTTTQLNINADERADAQNAQSLKEGAERILNSQMQRAVSKEQIDQIRATAQNLRSGSALNQAEIHLREKGIYPGDPIWIRTLIQLIDKHGTDLKNMIPDNPFKTSDKAKEAGRTFRNRVDSIMKNR